ncbi:MAG: hypothetical protein AAFR63_18580, partial [Cyanobacteria bacterium J06631_6]
TKLTELINCDQHFVHDDDLYYVIYRDIHKLSLNSVAIKLSYFIPPDNYLDTLPRYCDEPDDAYDLLTGPWYESPF